MAEVLVCYFVEDRAQEGFIKALVERVADEVSIPAPSLRHEVLSSGGGTRGHVKISADFVDRG